MGRASGKRQLNLLISDEALGLWERLRAHRMAAVRETLAEASINVSDLTIGPSSFFELLVQEAAERAGLEAPEKPGKPARRTSRRTAG